MCTHGVCQYYHHNQCEWKVKLLKAGDPSMTGATWGWTCWFWWVSHMFWLSSLRNEVMWGMSIWPVYPHQSHGKEMCPAQPHRSLGTDAPSLWSPELMGSESTGIPLGSCSAKSSHCCTLENFLTSWPSVKGSWTSSCLQSWNGVVGKCLRSQDSTRHQWPDYVKTFEDKAKWNFKRLRQAWDPLSEVSKFNHW